MEALHARYPFLEASREAVEAAEVDLAAVVVEGGPPVERALERVRLAIEEGTVGDPDRSPRVELLSYPVARVLVSLIEEPGLVHRYARAEADTARERFVADLEADDDYRSLDRERLSLGTLLAEFDLEDGVEMAAADPAGPNPDRGSQAGTAGAVHVDVGAYLRLTEGLGDDRWRLVGRSLRDGRVVVSRGELYDLLREAIRARIESDLPLSVPAEVGDELAAEVDRIRSMLADLDHGWDIDAVDPDLFPPCVAALLERVDTAGPLPPNSQFTLVSFLATAGMETDAIVSRLAAHDDLDPGRVGEQVARLREDGGESLYPPPSCETMQAYGDCVNMDDLCERIAHPLEYYEERLMSEGG
ncbi:MAG: DNA primase regulatory subunit PriL [Halobacteriales archaeon]